VALASGAPNKVEVEFKLGLARWRQGCSHRGGGEGQVVADKVEVERGLLASARGGAGLDDGWLDGRGLWVNE
jgi:hypothetical protein